MESNYQTKAFYDEYLQFCKDNEKITFSDFIAMKNYLMWSDSERGKRPIIDVGLYTLQGKGAEMKVDVSMLDT